MPAKPPKEKREHPGVKSKLHPRSKHRKRYDFKALTSTLPELKPFVHLNKYGDESVDFFDPNAVKTLNKALMKHHYGVDHWEIPPNYLSPPIPGRADYIHYVADLLAHYNKGKIPRGKHVKCLDIGVGASCIYPIIANKEFGWSCVGSDIDPLAIGSARKIIKKNPELADVISFRLQPNISDTLKTVFQPKEQFDLTICNPPFHSSEEEARAATKRKLTNLKRKKITKAILNFGGINSELWCDGGEKQFILTMIQQSKRFGSSCFWFTTLVSKESNLKMIYSSLKNAETKEVVTMPMGQGNKTSRIVAWTFLTQAQQDNWVKTHWQ